MCPKNEEMLPQDSNLPELSKLLAQAPFVNTQNLANAWHVLKDKGDDESLGELNNLIEKYVVEEGLDLSRTSLQQVIPLVSLTPRLSQRIIGKITTFIQDESIDLPDALAARANALRIAGHDLEPDHLVQLSTNIVEELEKMHVPDINVTCISLYTLQQTLIEMIKNNKVNYISKELHVKPIWRVLHSVEKRLEKLIADFKKKKSEDPAKMLELEDIKQAVSNAKFFVTKIKTSTTKCDQYLHHLTVAGELLLQAAGVAESAATTGFSGGAGSAGLAASLVHLLGSFFKRGKIIYNYARSQKAYYKHLYKWQSTFINDLEHEAKWDDAFKALRIPLTTNSWLAEPKAQVGMMRILMSLYDSYQTPNANLLKRKIGEIFIHYHNVEQPEIDEEVLAFIRQTAANCLIALAESNKLPGQAIKEAFENEITDEEKEKYNLQKGLASDKNDVDINMNSAVNLALNGWRNSNYSEDVDLYAYIMRLQTVENDLLVDNDSAKSLLRNDLLASIGEYKKPRATPKFSWWGNRVMEVIENQLGGKSYFSKARRAGHDLNSLDLSAIEGKMKDVHELKASSNKQQGNVKFYAVKAEIAGEVHGSSEKDIALGKNTLHEFHDKHKKWVEKMIDKYELFDRWETMSQDMKLKELAAEGYISLELAYLVTPQRTKVFVKGIEKPAENDEKLQQLRM